MDPCPSESTLLDIVAEQRVDELAAHLDACDDCRMLVAALAGDTPGDAVRFGRFEIERTLGAGAMGLVYLARDTELGRRVALKVLHTGSPASALAEARAMARLVHPNLPTVYAIEQAGPHVAIAMEYLPGGTLREWLAIRRSWRDVARVMLDIARALAAVHEAGFVHRDLKPDNFLFDARGRPRLADLGLAALHGDAPGRVGTPAYMAPEQRAGGPASAKSDQWSFCVCLAEAITGQRPRAGSIPRGPLGKLVARGLAIDPAARFPSMTAIARVLERAVARRRRFAIATFGIAALATTALVASRMATPTLCSSASEVADRTWGTAAHARLDEAYRAMPDTGAVVIRGLDGYVAAWTSMHDESCEATHVRGEQSALLLDRRTQCLEERIAAVDALVDGLARADLPTLARGGEAVARLPPIEDCSTARLGTATTTITKVGADARLQLARARVLRPLGHRDEVLARATPLVTLGERLGDRALVAEAWLVVADTYADDLQLTRAGDAFTAAELAAEVAGDDDLRARTLLDHASLAGALAFSPHEAAALLARARAVLTRLGDPPARERRAKLVDAALAAARGDQAGGIRVLEDLLATAPRVGGEAWQTATALRDLANMLGEQGKFAAALPVAREAARVAVAALGPDHVDISETLSVLALTLHFCGAANDAEAAALAARALSIKARVRGVDHVSLSSTMMVQALIARDGTTARGSRDARAATDRAIALRRRAYAADNPLLLSLIGERGSLAVDAGEHEIARAAFAEALPGLVRAWGVASPAVVQAHQSLALLAERDGDYVRCAAELVGIVDVARARCLLAARERSEARATIAELRAHTSDLDDVAQAELELIAAPTTAAARRMLAELERQQPTPGTDVGLVLAEAAIAGGLPAHARVHLTRIVDAAGEDLATFNDQLRAADLARAAHAPELAARAAARALVLARRVTVGADALAHVRCAIAATCRTRWR